MNIHNVIHAISYHTGYEATRLLSTAPVMVTTPLGMEYEGKKVADNVAIIPILRAGLAMTDGILELMPNAAVYHIGEWRSSIQMH